MKNSADLGGCYLSRSSGSVDNTLLDLQNSSYPTQPHQFNNCSILTAAKTVFKSCVVFQASLQDILIFNIALQYNSH